MRMFGLVPLGPLHQASYQGILLLVLLREQAKSGEFVERQAQPNRPARHRAAHAKPTRRTRVCALASARRVRHTGRRASTSKVESSCAMRAGSRTEVPVTRHMTTSGASKVSAPPPPPRVQAPAFRVRGACFACTSSMTAGQGSTRCVAEIAQNQRGAWLESPPRPHPTW